MDAETIEQRIRPLIAEQLGVEESKVTRNASFVESVRKRSATPAADLPRRAVRDGH